MRIAIVCWEFADAQRPRSLAKGLVAAGHDVVFVTSEPGAADPGYRVVCIPFTRASVKMRAAAGMPTDTNLADQAMKRGRFLARVVGLAARMFEALTQFPDKYRAWIPAVRSWLRADPTAFDGTDVVIASSPPPSALYVGRMLARACGARLVFDFRDLWTGNPNYPYRGLRRAVDRKLERSLVSAAEAAATATRPLAVTLTAAYPSLPVRPVYTGIDPAPWTGHAPRPVDHRLVFGHFGVWYPGRRTIRPLMESLRRLADAGAVDLSAVSVQLWGNGADLETWEAVRELGMAGVVQDRGRLAAAAVPERLAQVDVALLLAWPEDVISVPIKSHGYLASGKPVLVIGASPDSEMAAVLRGLPGVTLAAAPVDIDAAVLEYWRAAQAGAPRSWTLQQRPLPITQESMVAGFLGLLHAEAAQTAGDAETERGAAD